MTMNNQFGIMPEYEIMGECLANSENKAPFLNAKEQSKFPLEYTTLNVKKRGKYFRIRRIFASLLLVCAGALVCNAQNTTATKLTTSNLPQQSTIYGVLSTRPDLDWRLNAANNLLVNYERETQILTRWNGTKNTYIDYWLEHNKKVILNINN